MSWKKYRSLFIEQKPDETHFVLGLDIGDQTSSIAYFDFLRNSPETIDLSGGYGKPTTPTMLQYVSENKEWVFGEYAALNRGFSKALTLSSILDKLGKTEYYEIDGRPISCAGVLGLYIKDLVGNCKNINPKAEISGICVSTRSYFPDSAKADLLTAFKFAGLENSVISLVSDRDCILNYYIKNAKISYNEKVLLLDFGGRELRGGVYELVTKNQETSCVSLSSIFDESLGTIEIDRKVDDMLIKFYCENMKTSELKLDKTTKETILAFSYQHKDLLFQRNIASKPAKLYYNFVYPPFQQAVNYKDIKDITAPFEEGLKSFIKETLKKAVSPDGKDLNLDWTQIERVMCGGGGFEMLWAKETVSSLFREGKVWHFKNPKCVIAEGASIIAASQLGVIKNSRVSVVDPHQILCDIGVNIRSGKSQRFLPIVEKNSLWWQKHEPKTFIVNDSTELPINIGIYKREQDGEATLIDNLMVEGLPERPKGVTKIEMLLEFDSLNKINATISDVGFGEMYPMSGYREKFSIRL